MDVLAHAVWYKDMRQTVLVKGAVFDGEEYRQEAIEVWTNADVVSLAYKDTTLAVPIEPVKKLIAQVKRNGKKHIEE